MASVSGDVVSRTVLIAKTPVAGRSYVLQVLGRGDELRGITKV
jgi:hypothetical protein